MVIIPVELDNCKCRTARLTIIGRRSSQRWLYHSDSKHFHSNYWILKMIKFAEIYVPFRPASASLPECRQRSISFLPTNNPIAAFLPLRRWPQA